MKGFIERLTIVEWLIIVAIMLILLGVAIPVITYSDPCAKYDMVSVKYNNSILCVKQSRLRTP